MLQRTVTSDDIEIQLEIFDAEDLLMLTIDNLIGIICLCVTFYSLGYSRGSRDSKTQK